MARAAQYLFLGTAALLSGAGTSVAGDIKLESGSIVNASPAGYSRILPHAFYDQAISSLPHLFSRYVLLASRRAGMLGDVAYSLICFTESPSSEQVVSQALAVHGHQAWNLEIMAPLSYGATLVQVLEQIERLPSEAGMPRTPATKHR